MGEIQPLSGPGNGHIAKPPFLLHLIRIRKHPHPRKQPILHAHQEHIGKFQSLGAVHGHHHRCVRLFIIPFNVRIEAHLFQKTGERRCIRPLHIGDDAGFQLLHILLPGPVFNRILGVQHGNISGALKKLIIKLRQRQIHAQLAKTADQLRKSLQLSRCLFERRISAGIGNHIKQRDPRRHRLPLRRFQRLSADPSCRHIDDAPEPKIIGTVVDHAEIGQHVLDLRPVKEPCAANDAVGNAIAFEGHFYGIGLGVGTVEHCIVLKMLPLAEPRKDL